ncbi:outer membrane protein assembly factor BamD [Acidipila sp. EB88]|uniref:outer membrane protein assembly factor BamD n=1 Tax=Acidipila sp. EB88 TaxID=2305226 RepID=UPI00131564E5|nr:outer membrane protein assembly factor BamD [Acidipila sp. EB88]
MSFFTRTAPVLALGLCFVLAPASHAAKKKKKKQVDLSANPIADVNSKQPDKELYDKAMVAMKKGKYDIARLDLQTLMNTYLDSEYLMRAKLSVADTWYKEGGTAAMAQAEQEYKDFETFFPNVPEAAEAQMRIGDIYYSQMDKPDRDPQNAEHAETEYRQMIQQYPDSSLVPRAKQRLREVQEVLAQRQFEIGTFYTGRENWAASIARLQTVADNYPLFSHSDQTLITMGDAYAQQAAMVQNLKLPQAAKTALEKAYNDRAAQAWNRVVTRYPMAPHVEDAKDRLIAAGRPVPEPNAAEMAESEAEEGSRNPVKLKDRALLLISHGPSTIESVRVGEPSMADAPATLAPDIQKQNVDNFALAMKGQPIPAPAPLGTPRTQLAANTAAPAGANDAGSVSAAPITMNNVPETGGTGVTAEVVSAPNSAPAPGPSDAAPSSNDAAPAAAGSAAPGASGTPESTRNLTPTPPDGTATGAAAVRGNTPAGSNPDAVYGLTQPVGGSSAPAPLPPIDKPATAPDQINDVKSSGQPQVTTGTTSGKPTKKNPKPAFDKGDESSSKHKKKKGLDKLNPL